jgi:hypothetical protein
MILRNPPCDGPGHNIERTARERAEDDARNFGVGFTRRYPDGREEYIPPEEVIIHGNTLNAKTQPSKG